MSPFATMGMTEWFKLSIYDRAFLIPCWHFTKLVGLSLENLKIVNVPTDLLCFSTRFVIFFQHLTWNIFKNYGIFKLPRLFVLFSKKKGAVYEEVTVLSSLAWLLPSFRQFARCNLPKWKDESGTGNHNHNSKRAIVQCSQQLWRVLLHWG